MEEIYNLKREINNIIKLIKIEFTGKNSEDRLIDIAPILRKYVCNGVVPRSEKFDAYDLNLIRVQIRRQHLLIEDELLREATRYSCIFEEYTRMINIINEMQVEFDNNIKLGSYNGIRIIYSSSLENITEMMNRFEVVRHLFNIEEFQNMANFCAERFQDNIIYELHLYEVYNMTEEMTRTIEQLSNKIRNIGYIDNFGVNLSVVADISDEMLSDVDFCNYISMCVDDSAMNYINRYNNIRLH